MSFLRYPMVFNPILKERIWGGTKLNTILGKAIHSDRVGESWEISMVPGEISEISNGTYQGMSLATLIDIFPEQVLGTKIYQRFGKQFPLLFKFLDAKEDLSIQLHPNDDLAQKRHQSFGKTEMWYVMQADVGSRVVVGFNGPVSSEDYLHHLKQKTLPTILKEISVNVGDVFFIETGTIHAIGKGVLLAEIQQTSDITYRVYDWDRVDSSGKERELHIDLALDAIDYRPRPVELFYQREPNQGNMIVDCPYFRVNFIPLDGVFKADKQGDSFHIYVCTEGDMSVLIEGQQEFNFKKGDTFLIPAALKEYKLKGKASLLEIFIS
ncbi:type I phosphomannose isomerase catalytic subunit [Flavobacterium sp. NKUCC04_CG]|uniref:type I phosphomannose isomerase catalytic subunit n=1 Tax=Flavobacterium sp. NKUCC04_CG TaxID=2842121 RepID=UPI001C5B8D25|nr:type I phosphomannose isomerase catalytic subunit [Flavobacterium sp. NKUCC04_CG]MBW3519335.1 class I mannose-6-phosphate isomerase [Flavobacterium sp. NKUCC04_CG]